MLGSDKDSLLPKSLRGPGCGRAVGSVLCVYLGVSGTLTFYSGETAVFACILQVILGLLILTEWHEKRHPTIYLWSSFGFLAVAAAFAIGIVNNHTFYSPYLLAESGRFYDGIPANSQATAFSDGGIINFNNDSLLDSTRAVGMVGHGHTYCVAPVLSRTAQVTEPGIPPAVQFWAVGMDCCGSRADFQCNSAGEAGTHGGIVLRDSEDFAVSSLILGTHSHWDEYMRSIQAASALHELTSADPPVMVRWESDPKSVMNSWFVASMLVWLGSATAVGILMTCIWIPVQSHYDKLIAGAFPDLEKASRAAAPRRYNADASLAAGQSAAAAPQRQNGGPVSPNRQTGEVIKTTGNTGTYGATSAVGGTGGRNPAGDPYLVKR